MSDVAIKKHGAECLCAVCKRKREKKYQERKDFWKAAWVATASASDCKDPKTATNWANQALIAFCEVFK